MYKVTVRGQQFSGGKLSSETKGYRFDMGPSVFTMPQYVDELLFYQEKTRNISIIYSSIPKPVFYEDGTMLDAYHGKEKFAESMSSKTDASKEDILRYLEHTEKVYNLTEEVFLTPASVKKFFHLACIKRHPELRKDRRF